LVHSGVWHPADGQSKEGKNLLFLRKKKQKDFLPFGSQRLAPPRTKVAKVFCFFFSKKKSLSYAVKYPPSTFNATPVV
jgi:hypothetical protein